jgi:hypothetical protein
MLRQRHQNPSQNRLLPRPHCLLQETCHGRTFSILLTVPLFRPRSKRYAQFRQHCRHHSPQTLPTDLLTNPQPHLRRTLPSLLSRSLCHATPHFKLNHKPETRCQLSRSRPLRTAVLSLALHNLILNIAELLKFFCKIVNTMKRSTLKLRSQKTSQSKLRTPP